MPRTLCIIGNEIPCIIHYGQGHERACFVAQNPGPAARFFDLNIRTFIEVILRYGDPEGGLFGHCTAYYAMVESQG